MVTTGYMVVNKINHGHHKDDAVKTVQKPAVSRQDIAEISNMAASFYQREAQISENREVTPARDIRITAKNNNGF